MQASRVLSILAVSFFIASAADLVSLRGIVHDPQHRPVPGAHVSLHDAATSKSVTSDANGEILIPDVPEGAYTISISATGFRPFEQRIQVSVARNPVLHFPLELAAVSSSVEVSGAMSKLNTQTS
ncbi:MAG TPA: carboxypeptidase-like regulatory domain-containing protein, partial [Bryobacteraceae bacterium]|nr:carboxypeptidase-like regulatory domain-containing protein [Bryobacteraceae bacterium]